jgi:hypothetical protein
MKRTKKKRGRPPTGWTSVHLTLLPDQLADVDEWAGEQKDAPSRPEAVRRLIALAIDVWRSTPHKHEQ